MQIFDYLLTIWFTHSRNKHSYSKAPNRRQTRHSSRSHISSCEVVRSTLHSRRFRRLVGVDRGFSYYEYCTTRTALYLFGSHVEQGAVVVKTITDDHWSLIKTARFLSAFATCAEYDLYSSFLYKLIIFVIITSIISMIIITWQRWRLFRARCAGCLRGVNSRCPDKHY